MEQTALLTYAAIAATSGVNVDDFPDIWDNEEEW